MCYEAHIAGLGDNVAGKRVHNAIIRRMQRMSFEELRERRARAVELVREVADIKIVNAGGTGDLQLVAQEPLITEATAGSGFTRRHCSTRIRRSRCSPRRCSRCRYAVVPVQRP